ncbi:MAG: molybdopterin cofactor-binding domain-containing protein [Sphingomicrobium sp.]
MPDRRTVLIGGGAGIGLVVAWALWPGGLDSELEPRAGSDRFGNFIRIGKDGAVTVAVPQVETGQGSWTALPQIVADELGAAWEKVAVEPAPFLPAYANPLAEAEGWLVGFGTLRAWSLERDGAMRITAGATSVRAFEQPLREAGALARAMLIAAAAGRWDVPEAECQAVDGFVFHRGRSFGFGDLAEEAAALKPPSRAPLRAPGEGRLIGKPLERLDGLPKANGSWRFAGDVRLPGLLYASARLAPPGGKLAAFDRDAIARMAGVRHLAARDAWIAVAADNWWAAERALHAANPRFDAPAGRDDLKAPFDRALADEEFETMFERGDYGATVQGSRPLTATYRVAPSQHLALEPPSATARFRGGIAELWAASQAPGLASAAAGDDGTFYPMPAGDPAGRSLGNPAAPIALHLARATGRPVQVTLSQTTAQAHDPAAPGALVRMTALPGAGGLTAALRMDLVSADGIAASLAGLAGTDVPKGLGERGFGAVVPPYDIPNLLVRGATAAIPCRIGYMRASPEREAAFASESFIDELARAAGLDPLSLRMALLGTNGRLARCFQAAARRGGWDGGGAGSNLGIAGASAFGSHIAVVAGASIGADQRVQVDSLTCAVDCGRVINAGLVRQQVEGALIWALGQATAQAPEWRAAMPVPRRLSAIGLPRVAKLPPIDIVIISSGAAPGGVNGLGAIPLAPAVANAVFAGTGRRMRALPFDPMAAA